LDQEGREFITKYVEDVVSLGKCCDLVAWKKAFDLTLAIYRETCCFPAEEKFVIPSQIRRAALSVPSNIAEGQGRNSRGEFRRHLAIAQGSLQEMETQILIAEALGYLGSDQVSGLLTKSAEVGRLINGLSKSLNR